MFGIKDYNPTIVSSSQDLLREFGPVLYSFVGKSLTDIWTLWDFDDNRHLLLSPSILSIEGINLEVCLDNLSDMALSIDSIRLHSGIFRYVDDEGWEDETYRIQWRSNCLPALSGVNHRVIKEVRVLEGKLNVNRPDGWVEEWGWLLRGLEFMLDGAYLKLINIWGENHLVSKPEEDGCKRILIGNEGEGIREWKGSL